MLMAVCGNVGTGKTLFLTYFLAQEYISNNAIYANYNLFEMDYYYMKSPDDFEEMEKGVFGGDELWLWADSRQSQSKQNKFVSKIASRSRHKQIDIIYTTQDIRQIDARIRRITDIFYYPEMRKNGNLCVVNSFNKRTMDTSITKFSPKLVYPLYDTHEDLRGIEL